MSWSSNMVKRVITIIVVVVIILGLALPMFNLFAATVTEQKSETLKEVGDIINELINLKDNSDLTNAEKEKQEISIRQEALKKIIELSKLELDDLRKKLDVVEVTGNEQKELRKEFYDTLDLFATHYATSTEQVMQENLTLPAVKELAKQFKEWRDTYYTPQIQLLLNFLLVYNTVPVLSTADTRLEKIMSDLRKLENARLIVKSDYQRQLDQAVDHLTSAHVFQNRAEQSLLAILREQAAHSTTTISDLETATTTATTTIPELAATTTPATTTVKIIDPRLENTKDLIRHSLEDIKSAYNNFLDISKNVKRKLGL